VRLFHALKYQFTAKNRSSVWRFFRGQMTVGGRSAGAEDAMWADISEVPTAATRAVFRAYVDEQLVKYKGLSLDAVGGPNPTYAVEKRW
jgi:hypothetical protein